MLLLSACTILRELNQIVHELPVICVISSFTSLMAMASAVNIEHLLSRFVVFTRFSWRRAVTLVAPVDAANFV